MLYFAKKMQAAAFAAVVTVCGAGVGQGHAQSASSTPSVTYTASGRFSTTVASGTDIFKLAGEPFNISLVVSEATKPHTHGKGYATYTGLSAKGTVTTALIPQSPFTLSSTHAFMALALGNPKYDVIELVIPVTVIKEKVTITAKIIAPHGSFTKWSIAPFNAPIRLTSSNATITYTNGTGSTTLSAASGSVTAQ
jgi:hypothetical protein